MSTTCTYSSQSCLLLLVGEVSGEAGVSPPNGVIGSERGGRVTCRSAIS